MPPGTNGGVTLTGLGAGLLGSMIIVTTAMFFVPFCGKTTTGGRPWTQEEYRTLMGGLTVWGALGSVLDSALGALLQRSVRDARTGKIIEGEGGNKVLVSSSPSKELKRADVKAAVLVGEGKGSSVEDNSSNAQPKSGFGEKGPSRVIESGWDILDNNDVNFLMAFTMSVSSMVVAGWYWGYTFNSILLTFP